MFQKNSNANIDSLLKLFNKLCQLSGTEEKKLSQYQLQELINNINSDDKLVMHLINKLIENFDNISQGEDYITREGIRTAFRKGFLNIDLSSLDGPTQANITPVKEVKQSQYNPHYDFQDPKTITRKQLIPPIDIKV